MLLDEHIEDVLPIPLHVAWPLLATINVAVPQAFLIVRGVADVEALLIASGTPLMAPTCVIAAFLFDAISYTDVPFELLVQRDPHAITL